MALDIRRAEPADPVDLSEKGRGAEGQTISLDRRLFMQLLVFGGCENVEQPVAALAESGLDSVLYADLNDPYGFGLLTFSTEPEYFVGTMRKFLNHSPFRGLTLKQEYTMFGRTYAIGYENDLQRVLIDRPRSRVLNPDWPWAIWYPLRRSGRFEQLSAEEQRVVLMEHGGIGRAFGEAGYGYDVRLACYGLDKNDNDFVIGLVGPALHPLSAIVERMRKTKQTSLYLEKLGPFFIGKAIWQSKV